MNRNVRMLLTGLLLAVFLFGIGQLISGWLDKSKSAQAYELAEALAAATQPPTEAAEEPTEVTEAPTEPEPTQPRMIWVPAAVEEEDPDMEELLQLDLEALWEVNPDVLGWIRIPRTKINYPITQGEDNTYYLEYSWDKSLNVCGAIFMECLNSPDLTDFNTIIYGHNMLDGSMFAALQNYSIQSYYGSHPYVYLLTREGVFRYEIFSSYYADVTSITYCLSFNQEETRREFLEHAKEQSVIETDVTPSVNDRILTLSTCTGRGYGSRRVVHARLRMVETEEKQ